MKLSPELEDRILSMAGVTATTARPPESRPMARGEIRQPKGMNKTEAQYGAILEARKAAGEIVWYRFEGVTLKLADDTRYTPDFILMRSDGFLECHEVKGFWRDDAKVKIKVAASLYPFRFLAARKIKGGWDITEYRA